MKARIVRYLPWALLACSLAYSYHQHTEYRSLVAMTAEIFRQLVLCSISTQV